MLREIAAVMVNTLRHEDLVARLGGDEFAVLFVGNDDQDGAASERLRAAIETHMASCGRRVSASVGSVCFFAPPASPSVALAEVDGLMYQAKIAGKNRILHRNWRSDAVRKIECAAD